jgi:hypothetical protein
VLGSVKNASTENLCRGFFRITGLARVTLLVGIALTPTEHQAYADWLAAQPTPDDQTDAA